MAPCDYISQSTELTFHSGSVDGMRMCTCVIINEDILTEGPESFEVFLTLKTDSQGLGVTLGSSLTTITISDVVRCGSNPCDTDASCVDTADSFICTCNPGFQGDGFKCIETDQLEFEQSRYQVLEDICANGFALRVCICTFALLSDTTVTVVTVPGTAQGGQDYKEINRQFTIIAGRNRICIPIIIFEDQEAEGYEHFEVTIVGMDATATVMIQDVFHHLVFEQSRYEVLEDVGVNNFALRVCIFTSELLSDTTVTVVTVPGTAQGGQDYKEINREFSLIAGRNRTCIPIIIFEDQEAETDECFEVTIVGFDTTATVIILDDDSNAFTYIGNTPDVFGRTVTFNLQFGRAVAGARCAVVSALDPDPETVDCFAGTAQFVLQRRLIPFTPRMIITGLDGSVVEINDEQRSFRLGFRGRCSVHLINEIVVTSRPDGSMRAVVKWQPSAENSLVNSIMNFTCELNNGIDFPCTSPLILNDVEPRGENMLQVRPAHSGCRIAVTSTFSF